jgi:hypothetical protein
MDLQFDKNKNLRNDLTLKCKQFQQHFGFNEERGKKVINLFQVANKFKKIGCNKLFVFGSFATQKEFPNDIDVCFDIVNLNEETIEENDSLFDKYERRRIHKYFQVHIAFFKVNNNDEELKRFMKKDRDGNQRGIIEIDLKDLPVYDKE